MRKISHFLSLFSAGSLTKQSRNNENESVEQTSNRQTKFTPKSSPGLQSNLAERCRRKGSLQLPTNTEKISQD